MADNSESDKAVLAADPNAIIPRIKLSEQGFTGLRVSNKQIVEEANIAFRFPAFFKTINEMRNDPTVAAAFNVYRMLISRVTWTVEPPVDATPQQKERAKFVQQCTKDMEGSWASFISDVLTYLEYGHSVQEKIFRRRLRKNGSRYNDGLVGLRKLAPRSQETIQKWYFSEDGRELEAIGQSLVNLENGYRYTNLLDSNGEGVIRIPREKFLLFTADSTNGNPQGRSLLKPIYLAYKRMHLIQDQESLGVSKDAAGLPVIQLPPQYMGEGASTAEQAVFAAAKTIAEGLANGTINSVVFPHMYDPDTKGELFKINLLDRKGTAGFDLNEIIRRYQHDILVALCVDVIAMGQDKGGSFSLADQKSSLLSMALSHRLNEIAEVLNTDLIPQLFALNGWTDEELPKFVPGDIENVSMDELGKYIQRTASVGLIEKSRGLLNRIYEAGGFPVRPDDEPVDEDNLTGASSRSGDGMQPGTSGNGTSKIGGSGNSQDGSTNNNDNAS